MEAEILPLFSFPVYSINLEKFQTADDLLDLDNTVTVENTQWLKNHDNMVSVDNHWLESIKDKKLYSLIQHHVKQYFYGLMQATDKISISITESWLNNTAPGEQHHRHRHSNSIISGVYYFAVSPDSGNLIFSKTDYQAIEFGILNSNIYNSKHWILTPKKHTLILFPSALEHKVTKNLSDQNRISLSFNTFIKGEISTDFLQGLTI